MSILYKDRSKTGTLQSGPRTRTKVGTQNKPVVFVCWFFVLQSLTFVFFVTLHTFWFSVFGCWLLGCDYGSYYCYGFDFITARIIAMVFYFISVFLPLGLLRRVSVRGSFEV